VSDTAQSANGGHGAEQHGGCPVVHMDFSSDREVGCHWQLAEEMREEAPAYYNDFAQGYWIFTRHDAVRDIYKTPDLFSSESFVPWIPEPEYRFIPTQIDPPDHVKYRRILNPWFSPRAVEEAEPRMREICRPLVSEIAPHGECDFIADFALRYPTDVFLSFVGVPLTMTDQLVRWVDDYFAGQSGDPSKLQGMTDALQGIHDYWAGVLAERREDPEPREGDLASYLLHASFDERPLADNEILDMLQVLVLAGLDTTRGQLGYMFRHLAAHPEHRRRLIEEPELIPNAVEEALRYYTIIFGDGRKVTRDTEFYGVELKKGEMVYGLVSGANRDPRHYERADEYVIDRERIQHMGFANGPHRCLGAHLARKEMQVVVSEWLAQVPDFEVAAGEPLLERGGGAMMSLAALPLRWEVER
jgi:cytochrome P450